MLLGGRMATNSQAGQGWRTLLIVSLIGIPAAVIATVVGGLILASLAGSSPGSGPQAGSPSDSTPAAEIPRDAQSPTPEPETSENPSAVQTAVFTPMPLSTHEAADTTSCKVPGNSGYSWENEISPIAGVPYTFGMTCIMSRDNAIGQVDYLVPAGASRITVTAGQPDDESNTTTTIRFEVVDVLSGGVLAAHDLSFGQSASIDVAVSGLVRIGLRASMLSFAVSPRDDWSRASWAEPTFR
ncbi:hypothetical protein [Microbacterium gallinarum]|uniref:Glycosyl hydrolase family 98 putative carbohydrate-binding module domain-containing protein n=1 Tax=Microbacterium gallinarum TaxID=2762209 RepID=A0ABR8X5J8_9MICO|nr:hypothetical protein [Microbacterium gallinarum]MBD8024602.1 hypothetical protein [Microbacterium gallinarum]